MRTDSKSKKGRGAKRSSGSGGSSSNSKRIYASQTVAKIADKGIFKVLNEETKKKPAVSRAIHSVNKSILLNI